MSRFFWVVMGTCMLLFTVGIVGLMFNVDEQIPKQNTTQEQLDTIYIHLVGEDSASVLNTLKRVRDEMDALCVTLSGERC